MQPQGRGSRDPPSSLAPTPLHASSVYHPLIPPLGSGPLSHTHLAIHAVIRISNPILEITTEHTKFCSNLHKNVPQPRAFLRGQRENNPSYRQQKIATYSETLVPNFFTK